MDKALEKINELKDELKKLYIEKGTIEDKIDVSNQDKILISIEQNKLLKAKNKLKNRKENIEYKQTNLKKWKKQMIIWTIIIISVFESVIICGSFLYLPPQIALITSTILSITSIAGAIWAGDVSGYRLSKKYLKEHKLEDAEKEIDENNKELGFNQKEMDANEKELLNLLNILKETLNNIDALEKEIKKLQYIRNSVINEYIMNNLELDNLINNEYEKHNSKQLIKKNDSN